MVGHGPEDRRLVRVREVVRLVRLVLGQDVVAERPPAAVQGE